MEIFNGIQELDKPIECYIQFDNKRYASSDNVYKTQYLIVDYGNGPIKIKINKQATQALIANGIGWIIE